MKTYCKIIYADGTFEILKGDSMLDIIKCHNLETEEHRDTRVYELKGEQLAIAMANDEE